MALLPFFDFSLLSPMSNTRKVAVGGEAQGSFGWSVTQFEGAAEQHLRSRKIYIKIRTAH
jgi:hypothetical protein